MARQVSFIKLKGRVGDLSFYKSGGEYLARTKGGVDGDRIKTDPRFERTRENGREFLRSVKAGKLLRDAFSEHIFLTADRGMSGRLTSALSKVIKSDPESVRGERTVMNGELGILAGFEFNNGSNLDGIFLGRYTTQVAEGIANAELEAFSPSTSVRKPESATHAQLVMVAGNFNFNELTSSVASVQSDTFDLSETEHEGISLNVEVPAIEGGSGLVMLGLAFWQEVNGQLYKLNNGARNALRIVAVE
jgi:predicted transcriptional regulator with HTH domain